MIVCVIIVLSSPRKFGEKQRRSRMWIHHALKAERRCWRNSLIATRLTFGAPVEQAVHVADALHADGVAADFAALTIAAIHRQTVVVVRFGWCKWGLAIGDTGTHHACDCLHQLAGIVLGDRTSSGKRAQPNVPKRFASVHIAHTTGHVLIEQHFGNRGRWVGVIKDAPNTVFEVRLGMQQIGAEPARAGVTMTIELTEGLDDWSVETHGHPIGNFDAHAQLFGGLMPVLADPIQTPRTREPMLCVQGESVVPHDLEMPAVDVHLFDDATDDRRWTRQLWRGETDSWLTDQRGSQRRGGAMGCNTIEHATHNSAYFDTPEVIPDCDRT